MATNRADTLDPALLRPGRLDRKIEFPLPDRRQKRLVFTTITSKMNLSEEVDLEDCILLTLNYVFLIMNMITFNRLEEEMRETQYMRVEENMREVFFQKKVWSQ